MIRLDASAAVRTPEGFLRVPARVTRVGIMEYRRGGRVVRELRSPEQVLREDSYRTLAGVPVTIGHAVPLVTARDTRDHAVGYVESDVRPAEGRYLDATVRVWRADAADAVERRELTELSAGYRTAEGPSGVWQGQQYDLEQRDIRYNHVALLPPGHARGGRELSLRLDSHDLITFLRERLDRLDMSDDALAQALDLPDANAVRLLLDGDMGLPSEAILTRAANVIHLPVADLLALRGEPQPPEPGKAGMKRQITINGMAFEVEVPDAMGATFDGAVAAERQARTDASDVAQAATAKLTETETKLGEVTAERDKLKARCDAIELERVREQAQAVHPEATGETARELHESVIKHVQPYCEIRADASDAEIAGMFAFACAQAKRADSGARTAAPDHPGRTDAKDTPAETGADAARKRMIERNRNAWRREKTA